MQARRRKSDSLLLTASRQFHVLCMDCCFFFSLSLSHRECMVYLVFQHLIYISLKRFECKSNHCLHIHSNLRERKKSVVDPFEPTETKACKVCTTKLTNTHIFFFFSNRYIFIFRLMQMRRSNSLFFFTFVVLFFAFVRIVSSPFLFTAQKNKRPEYFRVYEHLFGQFCMRHAIRSASQILCTDDSLPKQNQNISKTFRLNRLFRIPRYQRRFK